jgi:uncharacterized membrane protein
MIPIWKILETVALLAIAAQILMIALAWDTLPADVPRHYGLSGQPDAYAGKAILWSLPIISLFLWGLLTAAGYLARVKLKRPNSGPTAETGAVKSLVTALKAEIGLLFLYIIWRTLAVARGDASGLGPLFLPLFLAVTAVIVIVGIVNVSKAKRRDRAANSFDISDR